MIEIRSRALREADGDRLAVTCPSVAASGFTRTRADAAQHSGKHVVAQVDLVRVAEAAVIDGLEVAGNIGAGGARRLTRNVLALPVEILRSAGCGRCRRLRTDRQCGYAFELGAKHPHPWPSPKRRAVLTSATFSPLHLFTSWPFI